MAQNRPVSVVAALTEREGRVFLGRRASHKRSGGLWELPGGKLEEGESPPAALARELREELGLESSVDPAPYDEYVLDADEARYRFLVYRAAWSGDPLSSTDHDRWGYFSPREIPFAALAPLDEPVLRRWARERVESGYAI